MIASYSGRMMRHKRRLTTTSETYYRALHHFYNKLRQLTYFMGTNRDVVLDTFDQICVAAPNAADNVLDLSDGQNDAVTVGAPTHTSNDGFDIATTGTKYINSQLQPAEGKASDHDLLMFAYFTVLPDGGHPVFGTGDTVDGTLGPSLYYGKPSGTSTSWWFGNDIQGDGHDSPVGFMAMQRVSATELNLVVQDTYATYTDTSPNSNEDTNDVYFGCLNQDGTATDLCDGARLACWGLGKAFGDDRYLDFFRQDLQAFMDELGTGV